jgi:hypothetical protein
VHQAYLADSVAILRKRKTGASVTHGGSQKSSFDTHVAAGRRVPNYLNFEVFKETMVKEYVTTKSSSVDVQFTNIPSPVPQIYVSLR